jgi:hypothetical protein
MGFVLVRLNFYTMFMHQLRSLRWIALALALWMSATVAAAALAPLFKKADAGDFAVLCTSVGMKLVNLEGAAGKATDLTKSMGHSTLDCPACMAQLASAPPPAATALTLDAAQYFSTPLLSEHFLSREALTASARGPPLSA